MIYANRLARHPPAEPLSNAQLNNQERSALPKHAARARWHPLEAKARRESTEEIVYLIK